MSIKPPPDTHQPPPEHAAERPEHDGLGHQLDAIGGPSPAQVEADRLRNRPGRVFWLSVSLISAFVAWAAISPASLSTVMTSSVNWVSSTVGWSYLLVTLGCIGLLVFLALSRFGRIRLGADSDRPEFSTWAWLAMILSAVMGVGLISYGVAEPISHFVFPPHGLAEPGTVDAAVTALQFSYFDWGPHAWAVFGVFGLAIAYSTHRKGNTGLVSPMLRPILGDRVDGWLGNVIDVFAIIATLFGTTTSLGLGASQITEGLNRVLGVPTDLFIQILIIAVITIIFTLSAISGVNRGIKYISQITAVISIGLAVFVLFAGPTNFITNLFVRATGSYAGNFFTMSLITPLTPDDNQWMQWWTYFMMAWWLSWGAFVGVFLAKISRGRTIRQFTLGVMLVPSIVFFGWFTIFGGTAIKFDMDGAGEIGAAATENVNSAFFEMLSNLPLPQLTAVLAILLVVLFFISGADANTFVLSMLSSRGALEPSRAVLGLWGTLTGACAVVLLLAGGLAALQQAAMLSALPFTIVLAMLAVSLVIQLRNDPHFDDTRDVRRADLRTGTLRIPKPRR
ncbi:BCCT family transporter [Microbacterium aurum]